MTIGIFDSGMGGLTVLATAKKMMPDTDFIYYGDSKNAPYGVKTKEEVLNRSIEICDLLIAKGVIAIVIACNTATSAAIKTLRKLYSIPIIGMEPAVKPAIESYDGHAIVVMATPMTLKEDKYKQLLNQTKTSQKLYEIPAPKVVELVEKGITEGEEVHEVLQSYFREIPLDQVGSVVLGCTHYLFIKPELTKIFSHDIRLIDGNEGTILQLMRKIDGTDQNTQISSSQEVTILNSGGAYYVNLATKLLEIYEEQYGN